MEQYLIGDVLVRWDGGGYSMGYGPYMELFRHDKPWEGEQILLKARIESLEPYRQYPLLLEKELYSVYNVNGERLLIYHWSYLRDGYGIWIDRICQGREDVCLFDPALSTQLPIPADWFFGVSGLQRALLSRGRPVLHASYIDWNGEAILFTAPSGTGKTTQAKLWEQYAGAEIINGDRVLLGKRGGIWHAYGFPNCGSSDICVNRTLPVRAIVVLKQGPENRVEALTNARKLRSLASAMAVYHWDGEDVQKAVTLAGELLTAVPVILLTCRKDSDAVRTLKTYLEENAQW